MTSPEPARTRYTHGHERAVLSSHARRTAASSCGYLLPHLQAGTTILDVGCGPGSITLDLAQAVAPGAVTGIEPTEGPLEAARAAAAARGDQRTRFEIGDVYRLPPQDAAFDVVHAHQVLQHLEDPVAALREMRRVCRPGGLVAVRDADYAGMFWHPDSPALAQWRETYTAIARSNGGQPDAGRHLRAWVRAAGFSEAEVSVSTWQYSTPEETGWWGSSQADRVAGAQFTEQAAAQDVPAEQTAQIAEGWRRWGQDPDAVFVMPHVEVLARA